MALFTSGADPDAATAVCADEGISPEEIAPVRAVARFDRGRLVESGELVA